MPINFFHLQKYLQRLSFLQNSCNPTLGCDNLLKDSISLDDIKNFIQEAEEKTQFEEHEDLCNNILAFNVRKNTKHRLKVNILGELFDFLNKSAFTPQNHVTFTINLINLR